MKKIEENEFVIFGELAFFEESKCNEKEQSKEYLSLWKKNLINRLRVSHHNYELFEEIWGERTAHDMDVFSIYACLFLKLTFKKKLPYELG